MSKKVTTQELEESLQYLEAFAKGKETSEMSEKKPEKTEDPEGQESSDDEPEDELYSAHKKRMSYYLDKAMCHKGFMDKIKKGDPLPDEAFDDLDDESENSGEKKPEGKVEKGQSDELNENSQNLEDLVKAKVQEELVATKLEYEKIIKSLKDELKQISNQPVRKSLIKGADAVILKKALSGEKEDNKTVLSLTLQKSKVSQALFEAYEKESDEMVKAKLSEAVAQFESTGEYISPEIIQIMDTKGYKFIK